MEIIKMTSAHVEQIAQLEILCFSDPWSVNSISYELTNKLSHWLVALEGERVVGYIGSQSVMGEADMMNLCVHPDHRRKGIGEALVNQLVHDLDEQDTRVLFLEVRVSNANAIALYEKLGFVEVGMRRNYYFKPREDALIMRKEWTC